MNKKYSVTNLKHDKYDLVGIKLNNGKTCCYWKNKSSKNINTVVVILNNNNVVNVKDNEICISLEGVIDSKDQVSMIGIFGQELVKSGLDVKSVKFKFMVGNDLEEKKVKDIISNLGVETSIYRIDKKEENKEEVVNKALDDNKMIEASNGMKYTEVVGKSALIANLGVLANNEEFKILYDKYMLEHPDVREAFNKGKISVDQIKEVIQKQLIENKNLKEYELESADRGVDNSSDMAGVSNGYADSVGGIVNTEIGIVKDDKGSYKTVDDNGNVKNAEVVNISFNTKENDANKPNYGYKWTGSNNSSDNVVDFNNYSEEREQKEEYIYNHQRGMAKVRVLKKPERNINQDSNKSAAFVSLPVIMFIISLLLLIGSGIILFMMK